MGAQEGHMKRGVICTLLGATLWGFSGTCAQFLLSHYDIPASYITFIRMLASALLFLVVMLANRRDTLRALFKDKKALMAVAIFGVFGLFACQITYLITIDYTNAGTATILQCTSIVFVMVYTCIRFLRAPRLREVVGFLLAVVSTFIIATHGNISSLSFPVEGLIWGLTLGVVAAFYAIYPKPLFDRWGSFAITGIGMVSGGIVATFVAQPWTVSVALDLPALGVLALIVVVGTFGAFSLFLKGVADIGPMRASLLAAVEPVSATFFSWALLGTQFSLLDCFGFVLMILMVFLVATEKPEPSEPTTSERSVGGS